MSEYRISTNGIEYRIEVKVKPLFSRRYKWVPVKTVVGLGSHVHLFGSQIEAERALETLLKRVAAVEFGWHPLES